MSIKISFDPSHNPLPPTVVLARKNGDKIGKIDAQSIEMTDAMNDVAEISFTVYKTLNDEECLIWDEIVDFKLVYCIEWDTWFEITIELNESTDIVKTVTGKRLGNAELSQINLYNIHINTEDDIKREAYDKDNPTVLYRPDLPSSSLLHRIMEKVPHYHVNHVDDTIKSIQREFEFDGKSIDDAFQEIAEEIGCLFVYDSGSDDKGRPARSISVYDLESNCLNPECKHRGEFTGVCPKCNGTDIDEGYGEDTTIFITPDEIASSIKYSVDTDSVKNCFKLEAGDDLLTATVRNCNPNGSDYIWYVSDAMKKEMSPELVAKMAEYDEAYDYYQRSTVSLSSEALDSLRKYNELIGKYKAYPYNAKFNEVSETINGYPSLMNVLYDVIDFNYYLKSSLMPSVDISTTTDAQKELAKLTAANLSPVANEFVDGSRPSLSTADNIVLDMAKVVADSSRYKIEIVDGSSSLSSYNSSSKTKVWKGKFKVTDYTYDDDDDSISDDDKKKYVAESSSFVTITINEDYKTFVKNKMDKALNKIDDNDYSIVGLMKLKCDKKTDSNGNVVYSGAFVDNLKLYSLNGLNTILSACNTCNEILAEQTRNGSWGEDKIESLKQDYANKKEAIDAELAVRESEVFIVSGKVLNNEIVEDGLKQYIEDVKNSIQKKLDFEKYLGNDLWLEFCAFRREDTYSNENYKSDGLDNASTFKRALEFLEKAKTEIYKSSTKQHTISADLNNLLVIDKFKSLVDQFETGNWLRIGMNNEVYKLRLKEYQIDYDDMDSISVEFSDVIKGKGSMSDVKDIISQASSMSTSYSSVKRQAESGKSVSNQVSAWFRDGMSLDNMRIVNEADNQNIVMDSHGFLCRQYDPNNDTYYDEQLKLINGGLYITDDNWKTYRAGIGRMVYDDANGEKQTKYGVIADMMLAGEVGVRTENGEIWLNENGIGITVDENMTMPFVIQDANKNKLMYAEYDRANNESHLYVSGSVEFNVNGSKNLTAEELVGSVDGAEKTATNYLRFDSENGLVVGDMTEDTLGNNVRIDSDSVDIRKGTTVLSSFGSSKLTLGSTGSNRIKLSNNDGDSTFSLLDTNSESSGELWRLYGSRDRGFVQYRSAYPVTKTDIVQSGTSDASGTRVVIGMRTPGENDLASIFLGVSEGGTSGVVGVTVGLDKNKKSTTSVKTDKLSIPYSEIDIHSPKIDISTQGAASIGAGGKLDIYGDTVEISSNKKIIFDGNIVNDGGNFKSIDNIVAFYDSYGVSLTNGSSTAHESWHGVYSSYNKKWLISMDRGGTTTVHHTSSRKTKINIRTMPEDQANSLLNVEVVDFDYKPEYGGGKNLTGVIAEDTAPLVPEAYIDDVTDGDEIPGIDYTKFIPRLIRLCQIQQEQIDELRDELLAIKTEERE